MSSTTNKINQRSIRIKVLVRQKNDLKRAKLKKMWPYLSMMSIDLRLNISIFSRKVCLSTLSPKEWLILFKQIQDQATIQFSKILKNLWKDRLKVSDQLSIASLLNHQNKAIFLVQAITKLKSRNGSLNDNQPSSHPRFQELSSSQPKVNLILLSRQQICDLWPLQGRHQQKSLLEESPSLKLRKDRLRQTSLRQTYSQIQSLWRQLKQAKTFDSPTNRKHHPLEEASIALKEDLASTWASQQQQVRIHLERWLALPANKKSTRSRRLYNPKQLDKKKLQYQVRHRKGVNDRSFWLNE